LNIWPLSCATNSPRIIPRETREATRYEFLEVSDISRSHTMGSPSSASECQQARSRYSEGESNIPQKHHHPHLPHLTSIFILISSSGNSCRRRRRRRYPAVAGMHINTGSSVCLHTAPAIDNHNNCTHSCYSHGLGPHCTLGPGLQAFGYSTSRWHRQTKLQLGAAATSTTPQDAMLTPTLE
jgi:hypothetical protein